ncbi:MAG: HD domain-containing protein [Thermanaerothrix sp.]|nr:HD domain-containing protein [Thermanaerothrix sp.]
MDKDNGKVTVAQAMALKPQDKFQGVYAVAEEQVKLDKNGKRYRVLFLMDQTGSMEVRAWSSCLWVDLREDPRGAALEEEDVPSLRGLSVGVVGVMKEYKNALQPTADKVYIVDQEKYPPHGFVQRSPYPQEELEERFDILVRSCGDEVGSFLESVFQGQLRRDFFSFPAAVGNHHAYASGLLEHTVAVAEAAAALCGCYRADRDVVVGGALLHDIGKLRAYRMSPLPEATLEGTVLDHIAMGYCMFEELAERHRLRDVLRLHLGHIILSHHGKKEFGSPVLPSTPEALIVSAADELDFQVFCCREGISGLREGQVVSDFHKALQRRVWSGEISAPFGDGEQG